MNKIRGDRVPGDGELTHGRWGGPAPPPPPRSAPDSYHITFNRTLFGAVPSFGSPAGVK